MKTLIISLNSKYIHSSLASWYLKASCGPECGEVIVSEHTINENPDNIMASVYLQRPDIAAFSCYIWNISYVLRLASSLKKLLPQTAIVLGGPEVSYDAADILKHYDFIDFVIAGEADRSFAQLVRLLSSLSSRSNYKIRKISEDGSLSANETASGAEGVSDAGKLPEGLSYKAGEGLAGYTAFTDDAEFAAGAEEIDGLVYRDRVGINANTPAAIDDLDSVPSPYTDEMISSLKNKIVYFETSRGCPFSCSYCLSSATSGTRYFSLERVYSDLDRLVKSGVKQIKFVDRTFNANPQRAKSIIRHILKLNEELASDHDVICNFHFEVGADLFDKEFTELFASAPEGLFQLEAGVQSTNCETLSAVCRKTDLNKLFNNLRAIREKGNVHIHADLIAGLPFEDYRSFAGSFNDVYSVKPHQLQLGFLKFLKGTEMRRQAEALGYLYRDYEPYEILAGKYISGQELIKLKGIAELVDRYYNSGRFNFTLDYVIGRYFSTPFAFYESFYEYHKEHGYLGVSFSNRDQYMIFDEFCSHIPCISGQNGTAADCDENTDVSVYRELLRLDFLASDNTGTLPSFMQSRYSSEFRERCIEFLRDTEKINKMIPETIGLAPKQILKKVHFDQFYLSGSPQFLGDSSSESRSLQLSSDRDSFHGEGESDGTPFTDRDSSSENCVYQLSPNGDGSSQNIARQPSSNGNSLSERDGSSKMPHISANAVILMFSYFTRDKVTGRYQFFKVEI